MFTLLIEMFGNNGLQHLNGAGIIVFRITQLETPLVVCNIIQPPTCDALYDYLHIVYGELKTATKINITMGNCNIDVRNGRHGKIDLGMGNPD